MGTTYNGMPDATNIQDTDLLCVSRSPHTGNTSLRATPLYLITYLNPKIQLGSSAQVTGLDTTLATKIDTAGTGLTKSGTTISITNTTVSAGTYGDATHVPQISFNGQGQATGASNVSIQIAESQVNNLTTDLASKQPLDNALTSIANIEANTGYLIKTGSSGTNQFATPIGTNYASATFNNLTNGSWGSFYNLTSSSAKTVQLDATGLGIGYDIFFINTGSGAITFSAINGTTANGLTQVAGGSASYIPLIRCKITTSGNFTIESVGTVSSLTLMQSSGFTGGNAVSQVAGVQTTNATQTVLASVVVNASETITLTGTITGAQSDHSNAIGGNYTIVATRTAAGNVTLTGSVITNVESSSTATFTCGVDTVTQTVRILVTGVAATTYNWVANYTYQKVLSNT